MTKDIAEELHLSAKEAGIRVLSLNDPLPDRYRKIFQKVREQGKLSVPNDPAAQRLMKKTETSADLLVSHVLRLCNQNSNEADWRSNLEHLILERLQYELVCPNCKKDFWLSKVESCLKGKSEKGSRSLHERQSNEETCRCSVYKFGDTFEPGLSELFDGRAEKYIVQDGTLSQQQAKQKPDRFWGLRETAEFRGYLNTEIARGGTCKLGKDLKTSPFKSESDPLLFPFLLLEAKSEKNAPAFKCIADQSSLPLRDLINLQDGLNSYRSQEGDAFLPLVWFIANRGDIWKVYGCYPAKDNPDPEVKYCIQELWSGSLRLKEDAMSMLFIMNTIAEWARWDYRHEVLKRLRSFTTEKGIDDRELSDCEETLCEEDNRQLIILAPTTITPVENEARNSIDPNLEFCGKHSPTSIGHECLLPFSKIDKQCGKISAGRNDSSTNARTIARKLVRFIADWSEVLVLKGADLDELEHLWTGKPIESSGASSSEDFYVPMEVSFHLDPQWEVIRELSCLAISKTAFQVLVLYADYQVKNADLNTMSISNSERKCPRHILRECVQCLLSSSTAQGLLAAVSCLLLTVYPLPKKTGGRYAPDVSSLSLESQSTGRIKALVAELWRRGAKGATRRQWFSQGRIEAPHAGQERHQSLPNKEISFRRNFEQRFFLNPTSSHKEKDCVRCQRSGHVQFYGLFDSRSKPHDYLKDTILVTSLSKKPRNKTDLNFCLYVLKSPGRMDKDSSLVNILEAHQNVSRAFHTVHHTPLDISYKRTPYDLIWNLPLPYRQLSEPEKAKMHCWVGEFSTPSKSSVPPPSLSADHWERTQMIMNALSIGNTLGDAEQLVNKYLSQYTVGPDRCNLEAFVERIGVKRKRKRLQTMSSNPLGRLEVRPGGAQKRTRAFESWKDGETYLAAHTASFRKSSKS